MKKVELSLKSVEPLFEAVEKLTKAQRLGIFIGAFVVLVGGFVYFSYLPKYKQIDKLTATFNKLSSELALVKKEAADLAKFRKQMQAAEVQFKIVSKALPEAKEIPSLLASISQSGQDAGLEFLLFQPKKEDLKDFYAEIPVAIQVTGGYHSVAVFFDRVSRLSRIVNIRDVKIGAPPSKGKRGRVSPDALTTSCEAVTYRFIEESERPSKTAAKGKKKKKKK